MDFPRNNLDPASKQWAREVERRLLATQRRLDQDMTRANNTNRGTAGTLGQLASQISALQSVSDELVVQQATLTSQQATLTSQQASLTTLATEQNIVLRDRYINAYSFPFTNTNYVTRGSVVMPIPTGAKFVLLTGNVSLRAFSSANPAYTQTINHRINISYPSSPGGTNDLVLNEFSSLLMPTDSGLPMYVTSGGPIAGVINTPAPGNITFNYQTMSQFSGYVGNGEVSANIFGLFFYRTPGS